MDEVALTARRYGLDDPARRDLWRTRLAAERQLVELVAAADLDHAVAMVDVQTLAGREPQPHAQTVAALRRAGGSATGAGAAPRARWSTGSVVERVEAALGHARARAGEGMFTALFPDEALTAARDLDERLGRGEPAGPLAGAVVAVKDLIDVAGHRTTGGSRALRRPTARSDAPAVARLRQAGAVVIGAANLHALAYGALSTSSDAGPVRNPLKPGAISGGSSGGSAAAVAAGVVDLALGTDTAGSIRIPAALCGVVGLKPTFGRVPTVGVLPLGPSLDHVGPLGATVAEVAVALEVLSSTPFPAVGTHWPDLAGVRVGVPRTYFLDHLEPEVRAAFDNAVDAVTALGGTVHDVELPSLPLVPGAQLCTLSSEAFDVHHDLLRDRGAELPEDVRLRLEMGMFRSARTYVRSQRIRALVQQEMAHALTQVDVLLTPTLPVTAPAQDVSEVEVGGVTWTTQFAMTRLTMPFSATGFPAVSLPWGRDSGGGGIGMQIAGRPMDEATVLGAAHALEWHRAAAAAQ